MEINIMKLKIFALFVALSVASWAQTTTQTSPATAQQGSTAAPAKASCACCQKMDSAKQGQSCCRHEVAGKDDKAMACTRGEAASTCCKGKDAKACMKSEKDKAATCGDCCGKDHEKDCCASHKKDDKTAANCCSEKQCAEHRASNNPAGAGN
jgi:hypothetical protein